MTLAKFAVLGSSPISNSVVVHSDIRLLSLDCPWTLLSSSSSYKHAVRDPRRRKVRKERTFDDGTTIVMSCCCTMSTTCSSAERYVVDLVSFSSFCALAKCDMPQDQLCTHRGCSITPSVWQGGCLAQEKKVKTGGTTNVCSIRLLLRNLHQQQHHQDHQHLRGECITMVEIRNLGIQG